MPKKTKQTTKKPSRATDNKASPSSVTAPAKSWRDMGLPVHPAAAEFPLLSETDPKALRALGEDIKINDLRVSIVVIRDNTSPTGYSLIDGRNRLDALDLMGIPYKLFFKSRMSEGSQLGQWRLEVPGSPLVGVTEELFCENPYKLVASLNAHRRHLTPTKKRELIAKLLKMSPKKSNRSIAKEAGTHHHAVEKVRQEEEGRGNISHVETRTDTRGRQQPATKKTNGAATASVETTSKLVETAQTVLVPLVWTLDDYTNTYTAKVPGDVDRLYQIYPGMTVNKKVVSYAVKELVIGRQPPTRNLVLKGKPVKTIDLGKALAQSDYDSSQTPTSTAPVTNTQPGKGAERILTPVELAADKKCRRDREMREAVKQAEQQVSDQWQPSFQKKDPHARNKAMQAARKAAREDLRAQWKREDAEAEAAKVTLPAHISRIENGSAPVEIPQKAGTAERLRELERLLGAAESEIKDLKDALRAARGDPPDVALTVITATTPVMVIAKRLVKLLSWEDANNFAFYLAEISKEPEENAVKAS